MTMKPNRITTELLSLTVLLVLIFLLWESSFLIPLKVLVVFFHESAHAIATVLTGGRVIEMQVVAEQGGHVISAGGNRFITLSAGYLGSLLFGMVIYAVAATTRFDRLFMGLLGVVMLAITLVFVTNLYAIVFGLVTAAAMIFSSRFFSHDVNDFLLRLIGLVNMLYAVLDIYSDTILNSGLRSDARMLAEEYGGATVMWGGLWIVISVICIFKCLRWTLARAKREQDHV